MGSNHQAGGQNTAKSIAIENTPLLSSTRNDTPIIEEVVVDNDDDSTGTDIDTNEFDLLMCQEQHHLQL